LYSEDAGGELVAPVLEQVLGDAGFDVELTFAQRNPFYSDFLLNHEFTESGGWDIAIVSWFADYLAGRSYMPILFDGRAFENVTPNYGGYNNDELNEVMDAALAANTPEEAAELWAEADAIATEDAAWVPLAFSKTPTLHSDRVGGFEFHLVSRNGDFTNVWLEQ
jgi:peptide/nickel transport system substrate-binding protein